MLVPSVRVMQCAVVATPKPPTPASEALHMTPRTAVLILITTAALTPVVAALGLYESTLEDLQHVAPPVMGAVCALVVARFARARIGRRP
jgi:cobalamin synthase